MSLSANFGVVASVWSAVAIPPMIVKIMIDATDKLLMVVK